MTKKIEELEIKLRKKVGEDKIIIDVPEKIKPRKFDKTEFIKAAKKVKKTFDEENITCYHYAY